MKRAELLGWCLASSSAVWLGSGCSLAPKNFRDMLHPAPIVRARAVGLGSDQPEWVAVPAMIERLNDPDPVVRMTANSTLKERTHRDFGYDFWASAEERKPIVDQWKSWWKERSTQAAFPKDGELRKVSAQPDRKRRKKRLGGGQGGPASWPNTPQSQSPSRPQPSTDPTLTP